jgi:hypothetical protein
MILLYSIRSRCTEGNELPQRNRYLQVNLSKAAVAACDQTTISPCSPPILRTPCIMSLPSHLRSHKENTKEEATRDYFNVPRPMATDSTVAKGAAGVTGGMDGISCVLSIEGEAVHVRTPLSSFTMSLRNRS